MARTSFFKGVKSFLSNKGGSSSDSQAGQGDDIYAREGVAVTLTTEFNNIKKGDITLFSVESGFIPCQVLSSSCFENKAYVHYEPKKAQVALGTNPDAKRHKKSVKLTIEQYAWMIQQLQEEKSVDLILKNNKSPMLGIISMNNGKSIGKRLIRFVQQKRKTLVQQQCIFMLPKALLLQAASYIPMTKPLPPPLTSIQHHILSNQPYQLINDKYKSQLKRYCNLIQLCEHELLLNIQKGQEPTPPCSLNDSIETRCKIKCEDCLINTCNISTIIIQQENKLFPVLKEQSIMFPVSFIQYNNTNNLISNSTPKNKVNTSSAIQPQRRIAFDSIARRQKPHAISAFQYIPPDRSSSSSISSISQYSNIQEEDEEEEEGEEIYVTPQKYGYVAVDDDNEEILVVFPGMATSQNMLENASFVPVPWHEINTTIEKKNSEDASPWVLECALTAWHRCEMKVVTLLMRLCGTMPSHYKVVILGYSLGGAVASLCASSLRSTKLLVDRFITVCAIHSPRVGNKIFLASLSEQKVKTIRITHCQDLMAHLPPRTTGLLHVGESTVILPITDSDTNAGYILENMPSNEIEDTLNRTFSFKDYNFDSMVWDLDMNDKDSCK